MRASGILLHISSLPSNYGIGTIGRTAYHFIEFLKKAKQKYWQVLPIGPTSYGDSPYQTFSAFAGNPYFIDLDLLIEEGLLTIEDCLSLITKQYDKVNFYHQYKKRFLILKKAHANFQKNGLPQEFREFKKEHAFWLNDYALFMAIKSNRPEGDWSVWSPEYKYRDEEALDIFAKENMNEIQFWCFIQYKFFQQWSLLKNYANKCGIKIIGDMPIYVSYDSADVWSHPAYWQLDPEMRPVVVAGVPPDLYSKTGQLWGNPIFNYELMKKDGYSWWIKRIEYCFRFFDVVRIDHFRGFESYYAIAASSKDATTGTWIKGPGHELFSRINAHLGNREIIAEDLGFLTPAVYKLLSACGYPGMKVLQFGFNHLEDNEYTPHNYIYNSVVYPGTHDNSTLRGWLESMDEADRNYFYDYVQRTGIRSGVKGAIIECMKSVCRLAVIPMQDYLYLDDKARFNIPSTLGGNWVWRLKPDRLTDKLAEEIGGLSELYSRT